MPLSFSEAGAASALSRLSFCTPRRLRNLFRRSGSFENLWQCDTKLLQESGLSDEQIRRFFEARAEKQWERDASMLEKEHIVSITPEDSLFPRLLQEISDPPAVLHIRGTIISDAVAVAIVGTRRASSYGIQIAQECAEVLAHAGVVVVSGLALGIDTAAHQATVRAGGKTWAFLASGICDTDIYPPGNRRLAEQIIASGGALLSEFPPGVAGFKYLFPIRNRLIAGISLGTVVIEAAEKSGSLITASAALGYNREVFAVPADIRRHTSQGTNLLIKNGAHCITNPGDILTVLGLTEERPKSIHGANEDEQKLLSFLSREPLHIDELGRRMQCSIGFIAQILSHLELSGHARSIGGSQWIRRT